ncbi:MAG TPA: hypothetical protein VF261_02315 [Candidatus Saccharimonadales bacterium]
MSDSLLMLGRQPALGLAELEALYGPHALQPVGSHAARLRREPQAVDFRRLGGSFKLAEILGTLGTLKWNALEAYLLKTLPDQLATLPEGKITLGLSSYGLDASPARVGATALSLKKALRTHGRSVRIVPNQAVALNSAQVIHNHLTGQNGCEIVLVGNAAGNTTTVARTVTEQDIADYTLRDRGRPKRDTKVGMLPPKLAQIIINLAAGSNPPAAGFAVLDPFCGTGVILQEALLMGYSALGSDLDQRMIDYTAANLDWLAWQYDKIRGTDRGFQLGDATSHTWETSEFIDQNGTAADAKRIPAHIDAVASETYLGRPFTGPPDPVTLAKTTSECNLILKKFLRNIHGQLQPGTRLCLAVPAWVTTNGRTSPRKFIHLPLIDQLGDLGYNRVSFEHVSSDQLLYYREDQIVARELLVLTKQ